MPIPGLSSLIGSAASYLAGLSTSEDEEKVVKTEVKKKAEEAGIANNIDMSSFGESPIAETGAEMPEDPVAKRNAALPTTEGGDIDFSKGIDFANLDEKQTMALQKKIGATADGKWGPQSQQKLNQHYAFEGIEPPNAKKLGAVLKGMGAIIKDQPDNYDTIKGKKPSYATNELSSGGDVSPELVSAVEKVFPDLGIPNLRITAGNDAYHQGDRYSRPGKGAHSLGKAMDFTTSDPEAVRKTLLEKGYTKHTSGNLTWYKSADGTHRFLDEYAGKTKNTTGGHFDFKIY